MSNTTEIVIHLFLTHSMALGTRKHRLRNVLKVIRYVGLKLVFTALFVCVG